MGKGEARQKMEKEVIENPIMCGSFSTPRKTKDKWLGDLFHEDGLSASVNATILERTPRAKAAMFEIKGIIEDFRSQCIGGTMGALDLWELSVLPMLLNNSSTWTQISDDSIELLEELQNMFVRLLMHLPVSTPKPVLTFDTGLLSMRHRIMAAKLNLAFYLRFCGDGHLASQVYSEQVRRGWPGLSQEVAIICEELGIQNVNLLRENEISLNTWKSIVRKAVWKHNEIMLKDKIVINYDKLQDLKNDNFGRKDYLSSKSIDNCRMMMRMRSKMVNVKENFKNMYKNRRNGLSCDSCQSQEVESQSHVLLCPAYDKLRDGLDLAKQDDLIRYYREVLAYRDKKDNK
jgi:hypothetical protein